MIMYFSGTGNSAYVAKRIGKEIGNESLNLFEKIRNCDYSYLTSDKPWVIVVPAYAWRIPRIVHEWLMKTKLGGNRDIYFVMTCGDSNGDAGKYLKKLCIAKGMNYKGCKSIIMPENYIALFKTPDKNEALAIIEQSEQIISDTAQYIRNNLAFPEPHVTFKDKFNSSLVNDIFIHYLFILKNFMLQMLVFPVENVKISVHLEIFNLKMGSQTGERIAPIAWHVFVDVQKMLLNMARIVKVW
nr:EFR1 family ferrodoxin [[Clostridium] dakarense]